MKKTIIVSETGNPTPDRYFDYVAHYEGESENQEYGYGKTKEAAIDDFKSQYE